MHSLSRRSLLRLSGASALFSLAACAAPIASSPTAAPPTATALPPVTNGDEALARLMEGNARYLAASMTHPGQTLARRAEVAQSQHPFAIILTCADSRVAPELLFDQGLGDLFVVRVAGNIVDDAILGSIEYGVAELAAPLVMVLGHERCGAVKATLEQLELGGTAPGHIGSLVTAIAPALELSAGLEGDKLDNAIRANASMVRDQISGSTPLLSEAVAASKLKVVGAYYDLDKGEVTLL
jgi:carbonic anhydrase